MGFFCIDKPSGPTSHDMVYKVRRAVGRGVKVGHAGTLDPFAGGVLVVSVGGACRLVEFVMGRPKRYQALVRLGAVSDTDDRTGRIEVARATPWRGRLARGDGPLDTSCPAAGGEGEMSAERGNQTPAVRPPSLEDVRRAVAGFVGNIQQVPPRHSAVFIAGRRAYDIARGGGEVNLAPRTVHIERLEVLAYDWPDVRLDVWCGRGTYIRSLARDLGDALGVGGYCQELTRSAVGEFTLASSVDIANLDPQRDLIDARTAVAHLPAVTLTSDDLPHLMLGRRLTMTACQWSEHASPPPPADSLTAPRDDIVILSPKGQVLALGYLATDGRVQPTKVIVNVRTWSE